MALLAETFPQAGSNFEIARLSPRRVLLWSSTSEGQLRPGATVSGPAQFGLLDLAAYVLVLANVGRAELEPAAPDYWFERPDQLRNLLLAK